MFYCFLGGFLIWIATSWFLGAEKANGLPGGAVACALLFSIQQGTPLYITIPLALLGHYFAVLAYKFAR